MEQFEEIRSIFNRLDSKEIDDSVCAQQVKKIILEMLDSDSLTGEKRKVFRETFVSLDMNLDAFEDASRRKIAGLMGTEKFKEIDVGLRMSVRSSRDVLMSFLKDQKIPTIAEKPLELEKSQPEEDSKLSAEKDQNIKQYEDRISQNPDDDTTYNALGNYYFSNGDFENARKQYEKAIQITPKWIYYSNIGDSYRSEKNWDECIKWYEKAKKIIKKEDILDNNLGIAYYRKGDPEKAIKCYEDAIDNNPQPVYYANAGDVYFQMKNIDNAIMCYKNSLALDPKFFYSKMVLGQSYLHKYYADRVRNQSFLKLALDTLLEAQEQNPEEFSFHATLGDAYLSSGDDENAIAAYKKAIEIVPNDSISLSNISRAYCNLKDYKSAEEYLKKAESVSQGKFENFASFGEIYRLAKIYDKSIEYYEKALKKDPNNPVNLNNIGLAYLGNEEVERAIIYFKKALNQEESFVYYSNLGLAYSTKKDWPLAIENLEKAIKLNPDDFYSFSKLGGIYIDRNLFIQAIEMLEKAKEINPRDAITNADLSFAYSKLRKWDKAIEYAKIADALNLSSQQENQGYLSLIYNEQGLDHLKNNVVDKALDSFTKALELRDTDIINWNMYVSLLRLKKFDEAKKYLLRAIELKPEQKYLDALRDPNLNYPSSK